MRVFFLLQDKIAERQLDAATAPLPVTAAYCTYMQSLQKQPYAVLAAAFFAIEYVYNKVGLA
jgi:thiaminase